MTEATAPKRTEPTAPATAKGKPGRKPGQKAEPKPFVKLDLTKMTVTKVQDPETMREHRRQRTERDEDQLAIDALVRQSHQRWVEAGKPSEWGKCISASYTLAVPKDWEDTIRRRIQRAGTYFSVAIRFGIVKELADGKVQILFFAKDRTEKDASESNESESETGTEEK